MRPRTSIRGHVRRLVGWLVGRSFGRSFGRLVGWLVGWSVDWLVGWLVGRSCKRLKCAKRPILTYFFIPITFHASPHSYLFIHSFIYSFIHIFIYSSKTFIHKILIKRGALIGLYLVLYSLSIPSFQVGDSNWQVRNHARSDFPFVNTGQLQCSTVQILPARYKTPDQFVFVWIPIIY